MVLLMMSLASHTCDVSVNGIRKHQWHIVMPMQMELHDEKSHVAHHFSCLDPRNGMDPFMMLSTSCDTNTSASGIT